METHVDTEPRFNVTPRMVLGLTLALVGVVLTLDRLGIGPMGRLFRYWPVPIMVIGGLMWVQARDSRERFRGAVLSVLGTWLFLNSQGLLRVNVWELFWPVMLIVLGLRLTLVRGSRSPRLARRRDRHWDGVSSLDDATSFPQSETTTSGQQRAWRAGFTTESGDRVSLFSVMSHIRRASTSPNFRGGDVTAFMGGGQLDLRLATIPPGEEAVLDIVTVMGGVEIYAPPSWEVSTPIVLFMGGVEDKRLAPLPGDAVVKDGVAPRLVIRGFVMMGGIEIK
jgi:predicted membrane protein